MDRRRKVELFEEIRREYRFGVGTIQGVANKLKTHRRMVRQALASAIPPERKRPARSSPKLGPVREFIDGILHSDQQAPRKQRHTAHRIWERIRQEHPDTLVAEATVRRYVQRRKQELGLAARETFVPQSYDWGGEAQVDWYEATVEFAEGRQTAHFFTMRSMAGGGAFHTAYFHATQQAFLEAHERAFRYFGGVFRQLRYDNLKSAVKKILRGYQREETDRLIAFRSHWGFQTQFCNPAGGNEFPGRRWARLRESADEPLLGSVAGGQQDASSTAARVCGSVARTGVRGASRTQLRAPSGGAGSGALPGRVGTQAGRTSGLDAVAAVARTRALAGEFRPFVAELARAAREARGHARDDRVVAAGSTARLGSVDENG